MPQASKSRSSGTIDAGESDALRSEISMIKDQLENHAKRLSALELSAGALVMAAPMLAERRMNAKETRERIETDRHASFRVVEDYKRHGVRLVRNQEINAVSFPNLPQLVGAGLQVTAAEPSH